MKITKKELIKKIVIICLFIFGFYFRLYEYMNFTSFQGDEGNHFLIFDNFARFGKIITTGEGSGIGDENLYFHNLPYSIYFQGIIFFLANQSPLVYMFFYVLLSLLLVWLIWKITKNFFGEKAGLVALFIATFSQQLINRSVFASQPTNAVLFEAMSLYLFSLFNLKKNKKIFFLSFAFGVFAIYMYPPMLLFLPIKIIFLIEKYTKKINSNKKIILIGFIFLLITLIPLFANELKFYNQESSNLYNIQTFIQNKLSDKVIPNNRNKSLIQFWTILRLTTCSITERMYKLSSLFWICIFLSIPFVDKNKKKTIFYLSFSIFFPIFVISILQIDIIGEKTFWKSYLDPSIIYIIILLAAIMPIKKNLPALMVIIALSIGIFTPLEKDVWISFFDKKEIAEKIVIETKKRNISLNEIDMIVLNNKYKNNNGDWDKSMYWYFLQKKSSTQLVDISYPFLTPETISKDIKEAYVICESYLANLQIKDCEEKARKLHPTKPQNTIYFNNKVGLIAIH